MDDNQVVRQAVQPYAPLVGLLVARKLRALVVEVFTAMGEHHHRHGA